jgi:hypothetical protein
MLPKEANNSLFSVCFPIFVKESDIQVSDISPENVIFKSVANERCIVLKIDDQDEVNLGWNVRSFTIKENPLLLSLVIGKIKGVSSNFNFDMSMESGVKLISSIPELDSGSSLSGNLSSDKGIKLTISK